MKDIHIEFGITENESRELYHTNSIYHGIVDALAHGAKPEKVIFQLFTSIKEASERYEKLSGSFNPLNPFMIPIKIIDHVSLIKADSNPDPETIAKLTEILKNSKAQIVFSSADHETTVIPLWPAEIEIPELIEYFETVIRMYEEIEPAGGWQWVHDHAKYCLEILKKTEK